MYDFLHLAFAYISDQNSTPNLWFEPRSLVNVKGKFQLQISNRTVDLLSHSEKMYAFKGLDKVN